MRGFISGFVIAFFLAFAVFLLVSSNSAVAFGPEAMPVDGVQGARGVLKVEKNQLSSCRDIGEPGTYYLKRNVWVGSRDVCFNINSPGVILDCQGKWIRSKTGGKGLKINADDVQIDNCYLNIEGDGSFNYALYAEEVSGLKVNNFHSYYTDGKALFLKGVENSYFESISANHDGGFVLEESNWNTFIGLSTMYSTGLGLRTSRSDYNYFENVIAHYSFNDGLQIGEPAPSRHNVFKNLDIRHNGDKGITTFFGGWNNYTNATLVDNRVGIRVNSVTSYNRFEDFVIDDSREHQIHLVGEIMSDNKFVNVKLLNTANGFFDVFLSNGLAERTTFIDSPLNSYKFINNTLGGSEDPGSFIVGSSHGEIYFPYIAGGEGDELSERIYVEFNLASINTFTNEEFVLPVEITLKGLPEFDNPGIYRNGVLCGSVCELMGDLQGESASFRVFEDGDYSIGEI